MSTAASKMYPSLRALIRLVLQSTLPRPQKVVLIALLVYARPDLTVYHAQEQLAWECDYTRPVIKAALAALKAQAIPRVIQGPHQHYATDYAIDLSRLPTRVPYSSRAADGHLRAEDGAAILAQRENDLPAEDEMPVIQLVRELPAGEPEGKSVSPSRQMAIPQIVQVVQEKVFFLSDESIVPQPSTSPRNERPQTPQPRRPRPTMPRLSETPAPETLPVTDALCRWATDIVPGLPLDHERDKFLCYARAHGLTNVDWSEALKLWWLEAHARAVRRGEFKIPAVPRPAPTPEPLPFYDVELHAQMQADIARLCGAAVPSMLETNDNREPRRRHAPSVLATKGLTLECDPAYLAQIQARKAMLQAQALLLQARESCLEVAGAAD